MGSKMQRKSFFQDKDIGWEEKDGRLINTFIVADTDAFINDIQTVSDIFQHSPQNIRKLDSNTVSIEIFSDYPRGITSKDYGLTNAINMIAKNQEELAPVTAKKERTQIVRSILAEYGFSTPGNVLTGGEKDLLNTLIAQLEKKQFKRYANLLKEAQQKGPSTETLGTPDVVVAPQLQGEMKEAIERIKNDVDPNYFKNVSRIDVLMGGPYGQVTSDDPAVVKINLSKVKQEVKRQLAEKANQENVQFESGNPKHRAVFDEVLTRALIEVVSHEKGHVEDFKPKVGPGGEFLGGDFPGGEAPAESEAARVKQVTDQKHPLAF